MALVFGEGENQAEFGRRSLIAIIHRPVSLSVVSSRFFEVRFTVVGTYMLSGTFKSKRSP